MALVWVVSVLIRNESSKGKKVRHTINIGTELESGNWIEIVLVVVFLPCGL